MKNHFKSLFTPFRVIMSLVGIVMIALVVASINVATGSAILAAPLLLAGFTEEQSKSFNDFISKQSQDVQDKVKGLIDNLKETELIKGINKLLSGEDGKGGIVGDAKKMQEQLDSISTEIEKSKKTGAPSDQPQTLEIALKQLLASDEFKKAKAEGFKGNKVFELKAATTDITGTVNMTVQNLRIGFNPERALAFIPYTNTGTVGQDKNRVLWVEGTYTSNVGYVGEGTGQATADTGTAAEKTRAMAKISAKLPLTAEMLEDAEYIASAFRMKMQEKAMLYTDLQVYTGDGNDSTQPNHIYGIKGHATAFNATTAGAAASVQNPNIGDLIDAAILQARLSEQNGLNVVWMNPADFFRLKKSKDEVGNYLFVKDINGNYTVSGLQIVQSSAVTANTMTIADTSKIQLWWKRNPEIKFSQMNGTDFVDDNYTAVMFLRNQVVIEGPDKTAIIHVADIDVAIASLALLQA